jgi:hypothetical protein
MKKRRKKEKRDKETKSELERKRIDVRREEKKKMKNGGNNLKGSIKNVKKENDNEEKMIGGFVEFYLNIREK